MLILAIAFGIAAALIFALALKAFRLEFGQAVFVTVIVTALLVALTEGLANFGSLL